MYKRVNYIALVPNYYKGSNHYTLYLMDRSEKVVMPVKVVDQEAVMFLTGKIGQHPASPHFYDTFKRLAGCFGAKLVSVTVYSYKDGVFYTYLNFVHKEKHLEVNAKFSDAFVLSRLCNTPLYINHEVLVERGIKVTKRLIKDALGGGSERKKPPQMCEF